MPNEPTHHQHATLARRTGLAYLGIIATGIFAEFAVRGSLIVDDDPITTAGSIADSPGLFGVGIGADGTILAGPARDTLEAVERHALGHDAGLIAFGLGCLVLGRILTTSRIVARPLAVGMSATGVVYLVGSLAALFAPSISKMVDPFYVIPLVVKVAFAIRLVTRGLHTTILEPARPAPIPA
jgi:hypothetical protein